jgi:hypothetical protein
MQIIQEKFPFEDDNREEVAEGFNERVLSGYHLYYEKPNGKLFVGNSIEAV